MQIAFANADESIKESLINKSINKISPTSEQIPSIQATTQLFEQKMVKYRKERKEDRDAAEDTARGKNEAATDQGETATSSEENSQNHQQEISYQENTSEEKSILMESPTLHTQRGAAAKGVSSLKIAEANEINDTIKPKIELINPEANESSLNVKKIIGATIVGLGALATAFFLGNNFIQESSQTSSENEIDLNNIQTSTLTKIESYEGSPSPYNFNATWSLSSTINGTFEDRVIYNKKPSSTINSEAIVSQENQVSDFKEQNNGLNEETIEFLITDDPKISTIPKVKEKSSQLSQETNQLNIHADNSKGAGIPFETAEKTDNLSWIICGTFSAAAIFARILMSRTGDKSDIFTSNKKFETNGGDFSKQKKGKIIELDEFNDFTLSISIGKKEYSIEEFLLLKSPEQLTKEVVQSSQSPITPQKPQQQLQQGSQSKLSSGQPFDKKNEAQKVQSDKKKQSGIASKGPNQKSKLRERDRLRRVASKPNKPKVSTFIEDKANETDDQAITHSSVKAAQRKNESPMKQPEIKAINPNDIRKYIYNKELTIKWREKSINLIKTTAQIGYEINQQIVKPRNRNFAQCSKVLTEVTEILLNFDKSHLTEEEFDTLFEACKFIIHCAKTIDNKEIQNSLNPFFEFLKQQKKKPIGGASTQQTETSFKLKTNRVSSNQASKVPPLSLGNFLNQDQ
jgi:hypothetical protein